MNSKTVLIVGCLVFGTILGDKTIKVWPKLYEEIGCKEINGSSSDIEATRWATFQWVTICILNVVHQLWPVWKIFCLSCMNQTEDYSQLHS